MLIQDQTSQMYWLTTQTHKFNKRNTKIKETDEIRIFAHIPQILISVSQSRKDWFIPTFNITSSLRNHLYSCNSLCYKFNKYHLLHTCLAHSYHHLVAVNRLRVLVKSCWSVQLKIQPWWSFLEKIKKYKLLCLCTIYMYIWINFFSGESPFWLIAKLTNGGRGTLK